MSDKINKLLSQYWDIAYQEGVEGRKHDTINYDAGSVLAAIQFEVSELEKDLFAYKGSATLWEATSNQFEKRVSELEKQLSVLTASELTLKAQLAESVPRSEILLLLHKFKAVRNEYKTAATSEVCSSIKFESKMQFELMQQVVNSFEKLLTNHKE